MDSRRSALRTLFLGLLLVALFWPLNWILAETHALFFPLWLGYVLTVDGIVRLRTGTSLLARHPRLFFVLFPLSVPGWWLFEAFNERLGNWEYLGAERFSDVEYFLWASLSFSTVIPAVFESAELVRSFRFIERFARGPVFPRRGDTLAYRGTLALLGLGMTAATLLWPEKCFPFVWTGLVFVLEPVCLALGRRAFTDDLRRGDWRPWMSLWLGGLLCGFFWEMWNLWSFPKWIYHVPYVGFWKVFEMPLLGYLGYLPFAMELYLMAQLALPRSVEIPLPREREVS
ncbi:MAG: hypothetical protein HUU28_12000 [Planctomycetaceae bacterium]|nr:hypothetical protein [Planctomycetaceae bacterium]